MRAFYEHAEHARAGPITLTFDLTLVPLHLLHNWNVSVC
jgi:hypothetical protein